MGTVISHSPTQLEDLLNKGYVEVRRTEDNAWITLENKDGGIIYDTEKEKIVGSYKFEAWQKHQR